MWWSSNVSNARLSIFSTQVPLLQESCWSCSEALAAASVRLLHYISLPSQCGKRTQRRNSAQGVTNHPSIEKVSNRFEKVLTPKAAGLRLKIDEWGLVNK